MPVLRDWSNSPTTAATDGAVAATRQWPRLAAAESKFEHDGAVRCCATAGDVVMAGDRTKKLVVRDRETGVVLHSVVHDGAVTCCAIADDVPVAGDDANNLVVWDRKTGAVQHKFERDGPVRCCAIADDVVVAGDDANNLVVRDRKTGAIRHKFEHDGPVRCCAIADGVVVAGDHANILVVRDRNAGAVQHKFEHTGAVRCCAIADDVIVAGDNGKNLVVWDRETGAVLHSAGHDGYVLCCAVADDVIVAGDCAINLVVRDRKTGAVQHKFEHDGAVTCCAIADDVVAAGDDAKNMMVRDRKVGAVQQKFDHDGPVHCCVIADDVTVAGDDAKNLMVWDRNAGAVQHKFEHDGAVKCCATKDDVIVAGDTANNLVVWDRNTGAVQHKFEHDGAVMCCAIADDVVVAGDKAKNLVVWDRNTGAVRHKFERGGPVRCCAVVDDVIVAGDDANKLVVQDRKTGAVLHSFVHDGPVRCCAIANDVIVAGDNAKNLVVWDRETGAVLHSAVHDGHVLCCAVADDVVVAGDDANNLVVRDRKADPSPGEVHFSVAHVVARRRPHLLHRRGPATAPPGDTTLLHRLAEADEADVSAADLATVLAAVDEHDDDRHGTPPLVLVPVTVLTTDGVGATPLDLALRAENFGKARALAEAYARSASDGAWLASDHGLARSLELVARRSPDLLHVLLGAAALAGQQPLPPGLRQPVTDLPVFSVHPRFHGLDWPAELPAPAPVPEDGAEPHHMTAETKVVARVVGIRGLLALDGPFAAIVRSRDIPAFKTKAMTWAVAYKWQACGARVHCAQLLLCLLGLALFWTAQLLVIVDRFGIRLLGEEHLRNVSHGGFSPQTTTGIMGASAVAIGVLLVAEAAQMMDSPDQADARFGRLARHLGDVWNQVELATYSLMLAGAVAFVASDDRRHDGSPHGCIHERDVAVAALCGCANIVATLNLVAFLRPYKQFGPLIEMLVQICVDIRAFLIVMLIFIVGFAMAFAVMLPDQPRFQMPMSLLTLFEMMLGVWDIEQFDGFREGGIDELSVLALVAFVLCTVIAVVIAMNLLIAIMGDSFNRVCENQTVHGRIERAEALVAMDWLVRWVVPAERGFPEFLHVLAPRDDHLTEDGDGDGDWGGRLKQLKASIATVEQNVENSIAEAEQRIKEAMKKELNGAEQKIQALKAEVATKAEIAELRDLLLSLTTSLSGHRGTSGAGAQSLGRSDGAVMMGTVSEI